jgi:CRISPR/Cas system-associated endonuclease Cas1
VVVEEIWDGEGDKPTLLRAGHELPAAGSGGLGRLCLPSVPPYGKPRSFVYDIADLYKFDTVVPVAFSVAAKPCAEPERAVRLACRDRFREMKLLRRIIPDIEEVLAAGGLAVPQAAPEAIGPAFADEEGLGDDGHRG